MNERIEKLKQKTAIVNLFKSCSDADVVSIRAIEESEIGKINDFLMKRETYTNQRLFSATDFSDLSQWIADSLKSIKISNNIIAHILGSDSWMVEITVKNWKAVIDLMLKNGGVCFYDCETQTGVCVGFDEESCYIDVKKPHVASQT